MAEFTNHTGLSLYAQVFLATDWYDHSEAGLSATTLLKPMKQVILGNRVEPGVHIPDVHDYVSSAAGSAIHDGFERSWTQNPDLKGTLIKLGIPPGAASKVVVNPTDEQLNKGGIIPAFFEVRSSKVVHGLKVTGKFDAVIDGIVEDLKTTGTFSYTSGNKDDDYIMQGSIYRWLNPDKVKKDYMYLTFYFTDWNKGMSYSQSNYPPSKMLTRKFNLLSVEQTEAYVNKRVADLIRLKDAPEEMLPPCTDADLWRSAPKFKFYKDEAKAYTPGSRSTNTCNTLLEAREKQIAAGGKGVIIEVKGEVKACKYCPGFMVCKQKDDLIASGDLIVSSN